MTARILHSAIGPWLRAIVRAAVEHDVIAHLDGDAETVATRCDISERGARVLLEALAGMGLVWRVGERYVASDAARAHLVRGQGHLGQLIEAPASLEPLLAGAAMHAAQTLKLEEETTLAALVEGGGADEVRRAWRQVCPSARFDGTPPYDIIVLALSAHVRSADHNIVALTRHKRTLRDDGLLLIIDPMIADDRNGDAWTLVFSAFLTLTTTDAALHRKAEYRDWLRHAGFSEVLADAHGEPPLSLLYAR